METGCTLDNYQCSNAAGHISVFFVFGCFLLLSPWLIVALYAVGNRLEIDKQLYKKYNLSREELTLQKKVKEMNYNV